MTEPNVLRMTCKQAAALVIAREDRDLKLTDTVALQLHMLACQTCPQFENQVLTMRAAMKRWRHYGTNYDTESDVSGDAKS